MAAGLLVTCWHCVRDEIPAGCMYAAVLQKESGEVSVVPLKNISRDTASQADLATANLSWSPKPMLRLASHGVPAGTAVFAVGHAQTEVTRGSTGGLVLRFQPQFLQGYVTRDLRFTHPLDGEVLSYELDMPTPPGLSGAPLVRVGTTEVLGVIYGTNDYERTVQFAHVDEVTRERQPDIIRVVSFGLAHHTITLRRLAGIATKGRPLWEYLRAPLRQGVG